MNTLASKNGCACACRRQNPKNLSKTKRVVDLANESGGKIERRTTVEQIRGVTETRRLLGDDGGVASIGMTKGVDWARVRFKQATTCQTKKRARTGNARGKVEVLIAVLVPELGALALGEHDVARSIVVVDKEAICVGALGAHLSKLNLEGEGQCV